MSSTSVHKNIPSRRRSVFVIIASYIVFTLGWILLSDYLLDSAGLAPEQLFWFGLAKGLIYILLSALLLYFLLQQAFDNILIAPQVPLSSVNTIE